MTKAPAFGRKPRPPVLERGIMAGIISYLKAENIRFLRVNTGLSWRRGYPMHGAAKGYPDFVIELPSGRLARNYWTGRTERSEFARIAYIEAKKPGAELRPEQVAFRDQCIETKALWWLVADLERLRFYIPPTQELVLTTITTDAPAWSRRRAEIGPPIGVRS